MIFGTDAQNLALVNLVLEKDPANSSVTSQWTGVWDHILLWHTTCIDNEILIFSPILDKKNSNFVDNICRMSAGLVTSLTNSTITHNHYESLIWNQENGGIGTNYTTGDLGFVSIGDDNYKLNSSSIARNSGTPIPDLLADIDNNLYDPVNPSKGAFQYGLVTLPTTLHGDVNKDGSINLADAALAASAAIGATTLDEEIKELADVSNDGTVTAYDAALILQRIAGIISTFPAGN